MTKGHLNNENMVMPKPLSILGYNLVYYNFFTHCVHEELIQGYLAKICAKVLLKVNTFDDMLYRSRDTWASKRQVVRQEGVINKECLCMVVKISLYNKKKPTINN